MNNDAVRVLYIGRYYPDIGAGLITRLRRKKNRYRKLRGQCGFMRSALHASFDVTEASLAWLYRHRREIGQRFDYLIVCSKAVSVPEPIPLKIFHVADLDGDKQLTFKVCFVVSVYTWISFP